MQPWHTPFLIWNQSVGPCPVLTVASCPAYRFLRRQVRWSGISISKNFPQFVVIHTVKSFGIVNKADIFWNSHAFSMIQRMLAIWSLIPLSFLNPAWTPGSPWFTYYWSLAWRILSQEFIRILFFKYTFYHFDYDNNKLYSLQQKKLTKKSYNRWWNKVL